MNIIHMEGSDNMKQRKYMTIKERREYMLNHDGEMPLTWKPDLNPKKHRIGYTSTLISGGDYSFFAQVKKGSKVLYGSGEHSSFGQVRKPKSKVLSIFRKNGI